jgi:hypothetical protein
MELWVHEARVVKTWTRSRQSLKRATKPKTILSKMPYARRHTGVAKSGDTSGKKARGGVANIEHV